MKPQDNKEGKCKVTWTCPNCHNYHAWYWDSWDIFDSPIDMKCDKCGMLNSFDMKHTSDCSRAWCTLPKDSPYRSHPEIDPDTVTEDGEFIVYKGKKYRKVEPIRETLYTALAREFDFAVSSDTLEDMCLLAKNWILSAIPEGGKADGEVERALRELANLTT